MNRWLRGLRVLAFLFLHSGSSWALCEAEIEKYRSVMSSSSYANQYKLFLEKGISAVDIKFRTADAQRDIDGYGQATDLNSKVVTGEASIRLCYLKALSAGTSLNDRGSSGVGEYQQPPQPYKPGTSTLDRYLTAPKEDCDAIPQSYNVSDRQFAVSQCRLRNANRDKYAANANAATAKSDADAQAAPSAQQQSQQAQQAATIQQVRADQARQGKRRRHEPENEASQCIQPNFTGLYGGMKNNCGFKVWYTYCAYKPKKDSWLTGMDCEKQSFGTDLVGPYRESAAHTKGAEMLHWFACKDPAWPLDSEFVPGQGVRSRCYTVGGN